MFMGCPLGQAAIAAVKMQIADATIGAAQVREIWGARPGSFQAMASRTRDPER